MPLASWVSRARINWRASRIERAQAHDARLGTWGKDLGEMHPTYAAWCNICGWHGEQFDGDRWCESSKYPACESVARDRYVRHCWTSRTPYRKDERALETSPRLGERYRTAMKSSVDYLLSDFDERLHRADLRIDLQDIDLPDASLDTILTAHVLEHVPDYHRALREIYRVLRPGGHLFLQVPMLQGKTAPPEKPEFHEDNTPVAWRFGWDLTDACREAGFETHTLVTQPFRDHAGKPTEWADQDPIADFDVRSIGAHMPPASDLTVVANAREARRLGFDPEWMYVVWECKRPA